MIPVLFLVIALSSYAQTNKQAFLNAASRFKFFYNGNEPDSIFEMYTPEMKKVVPYEKNKAFISGLYTNYGAMKSMDIIRTTSKQATYKTLFEKGVVSITLGVDEHQMISGLSVKAFRPETDSLPVLERNTTAMKLPFNGEWTVMWGGDTKEQNIHVVSNAQKNAFDFIIKKGEKTFTGGGSRNEDYYAFGQPVIAPCNATVVTVIDGVKDNYPGDMNPMYLAGNLVILKTENNEYLMLAHFKNHTIYVKEGDPVKTGDLLGLCGNSGNSSEPHLHFHIQNVENMNIATGAKCFFERIKVNGAIATDYSPVKGDVVSNTK